MTRSRLARVVLAASLAACGFAYAAPPPAGAPATQPAGASKRTPEEIMKEFRTEGLSLQEFLSEKTLQTLGDKAKRDAAAPHVIPTLKKMKGLLGELRQTGSAQAKQTAGQIEPQLETFLAVFGDQPTVDHLEATAKSSNKDESLAAQSSLLMVRWIKSSQDAAEQEKILADARSLVDANPGNENLIGTIGAMMQIGPANPDEAQKAGQLWRGEQQKLQAAKQKKLEAMVNKPLTIEGVRLDGSKFSTADWKGKVIFVDFWATWCGPCRAELPRVKKAYADFHAKGLEVLGVSCDNDADDLKHFLAENKDMPWPQLFDAKNPGWNPIATGYGIESIPTMFLIDKKGVLRSITARENFEEMIPTLLGEKTE